MTAPDPSTSSTPPVALVTGASRGIGRAVALELARRGYAVVATMRDPSMGASLTEELPAGTGGITVRRLDVTEPGSIEIPPVLDVLVNNAAVELGNLPVEHTPIEDWRTTFETNVFGAVEVIRRSIPALRRSGRAVICNLTSSGVLVPMPFFAVYRASKAALSAVGESLRAELAPFGVRVVEILPGPIDTDMLAASMVLPEAARHEDYRLLAERVAQLRAGTVEGSTAAESAARAIVDAVEDPQSPLRVACDPMGAALLEAWRACSDEESMAGYLAAFDVGCAQPARPSRT
ncbi:SDR family NAD(P)-dependent oxidoreductase [Rhabdothermincola sediminis]|uniref:SDR family NAD(P)-dependent oxidoreductase n=1 Tax=Rhabdothermincola sediminis TaxID=2751370 RepID=UPI001AA02DF3|nr:SDR family NAD(P)-dependent oxidoreductase [Rhabdothermincola sediminis]